MQKLQSFVEQGNTTLSISGAAGTIARKVQGSFPSATVTVYLAGTVTLAAIYSDNALTVKANPFTAAADGTWFFYAANGRYDVKFSGGGIATPFTLGDFDLFDESIWMIDVTAYGATGKGIVDDTPAFTLAIAACPVGGTVVVPPGNYSITTVTINKAITLRGLGTTNIGTTLLTQAVGSANVSAIAITSDNVTIDNISVTGSVLGGGEAAENVACIFITYSGAVVSRNNITISNCYLSGKVAGIFTNDLDNTNVFAVTNLKVFNNVISGLQYGVFVGGYLQSTILNKNIVIRDNDIWVTATGSYAGFYNARPLQLWNSSQVRILGNRSRGGFSCIELISSPAASMAHQLDNQVVGNIGDSHLSFTQQTNGVCSNNVVDMTVRDGSWPTYDNATVVAQYGYLPGIEIADLNNVVCSGNAVSNPVGEGIQFGAARYSQCTNNTIYNTGNTASPPAAASGISIPYAGAGNIDSIISNNTIETSARSGIWQWTSATFGINRFTISNNVISGCMEHGIALNNVTGVTIVNNRIYNPNGSAGAFDGIHLVPVNGGDVINGDVMVANNTINGTPQYAIQQSYLDAASNRTTYVKNNICLGTPTTQPFFFYGHRGGNWPGTPFASGQIATVASNHIDLSSGLDAYDLALSGAATIKFMDNITMGDIVEFHFNRADTLLFNSAGNLQLAGTANVTPTALSEMVFRCRGDANNLATGMVEISRMIA